MLLASRSGMPVSITHSTEICLHLSIGNRATLNNEANHYRASNIVTPLVWQESLGALSRAAPVTGYRCYAASTTSM